ncbi:hypothetical protein [Rhodocyclus purpureus]|uniref:hypothetical protein n=1 Tax=Rhodocyclus purpureus TaxID=1067 RepID=UPI001A910FD7|nr:hypothetical protein [Rhodocyclus purpureus]
MRDAMILAHELLCVVLLYTVFCRAVRTDHTVRVDVRAAFCLLGAVACIGVPAPLIWDGVPSTFTLALLAVITVVQVVTARHWANGVPIGFYKPECTRVHCNAKGSCNDQA